VYNEDLETDVPSAVLEFKKTISQADGIVIVTPEYNFSYDRSRMQAKIVFLGR
jgi:chromate reductase, NAD(P)H dehydrogenase (quinone)